MPSTSLGTPQNSGPHQASSDRLHRERHFEGAFDSHCTPDSSVPNTLLKVKGHLLADVDGDTDKDHAHNEEEDRIYDANYDSTFLCAFRTARACHN